MPVYERRDESHEVVEAVHTVPDSREDKRLANSGVWKLVEEQPQAAPAAAPAPLPKRATAKPTAEG